MRPQLSDINGFEIELFCSKKPLTLETRDLIKFLSQQNIFHQAKTFQFVKFLMSSQLLNLFSNFLDKKAYSTNSIQQM